MFGQNLTQGHNKMMARKGLLIGGSKGEDQFERLKAFFPEFNGLAIKDIKQVWENVLSSMRFHQLTTGRDKDDEKSWIEHTPIYKEQYLKDPDLDEIQFKYKHILKDAYEVGLLSKNLHKKAKKAKGLLKIIEHMNLIGFMASDRIFNHLNCQRFTHNVGTITLNLTMIKLSEKIDLWGHTEDGELLAPSDKKCADALRWLLYNSLYYTKNKQYLLPTLAQVNVRVGRFTKGCDIKRENFIKEIDEATKHVERKEDLEFSYLCNTEPSVISLYSSYEFLGKRNMKFHYMGYTESQTASIGDIDMKIGVANMYLLNQTKWVEHFESAKNVLTAQEALGWEKKLDVFVQLRFACEYWVDKLHMIGHEWSRDERDPESIYEENSHWLEILMKNPDKILSWVEGEVYTDLIALDKAGRKKEDSDKKAVVDQLDAFEKGFEAGMRGKPYSVESPEEKGVPYSVETPEEKDSELIDQISKCLSKYDEKGLGIHQNEVMMFLGCTKVGDPIEQWVRDEKTGKEVKEKKYPSVPKDGIDFVTSIFHHEHEELITDPPMAHPIYQSFLKLFPPKQLMDAKNGNHKVKKSSRNQRGIPAKKMAIWLSENLPETIAERLPIVMEQK